MLAKRIIPCLDVDHGRVKKGTNFVRLADVGDPAEIAAAYEQQGADELVFLDITATVEAREALEASVEAVASEVFMPLTVGGGVHSVDGMQRLLRAGADKVSVNSAAVAHPELISEAAEKFGRQCVVLAIDAARDPSSGRYEVYVDGGRTPTGRDALDWARDGVQRGAGELLVTSMDRDGTRDGFDLDLYRALGDEVDVPIIASGGCGGISDFVDLFEATDADGALAASVFHFGELTIGTVKAALREAGVVVR